MHRHIIFWKKYFIACEFVYSYSLCEPNDRVNRQPKKHSKKWMPFSRSTHCYQKRSVLHLHMQLLENLLQLNCLIRNWAWLLNVFLLSVCAMNAIKIADCDCLARIRYILMIMLEKVLHIIWVVCNWNGITYD